MDIFFKRIEWKITDSNYVDIGLQQSLLIKGQWPQVRTKENLIEEGQDVLFHTKKISQVESAGEGEIE